MYNRKPLTQEQLDNMNEDIHFELVTSNTGTNYILWSKRKNGRGLYYRVDENGKGFEVASRNRKVKIDTLAIQLWIDEFKDKGYTLLDVQQAVSVNEILFIEKTNENVKTYLDSIHKQIIKY